MTCILDLWITGYFIDAYRADFIHAPAAARGHRLLHLEPGPGAGPQGAPGDDGHPRGTEADRPRGGGGRQYLPAAVLPPLPLPRAPARAVR